ncbi:hypothetical protein WR25_02570 [Diploscapter pachys]|uniref:Uncharacterized protein n=1 Tax=Diploscapter pachys TaxID=2018661 RepID=A0A2A2LAE1_9BILA|nr:hypothetical protein WR25_02570 [Diploscapter pachys]
MAHIKFVGFDMDATLAIYKTPQADKLAFETAKKRLVEVGYPPEIGSLSYDDKLVTRGVWFDKKLGNFLKMDEENGVLAAWHGTRRLNDHQIRVSYPNKHIQLEDSRIYIMNTVFNVSKTHLIASIISFMEENEKFTDMPNGEGFISHGRSITYHRIFADCHDAFDWVYTASNYRNILVENISHFIEYTPECGRLLKTLSNGGERQVFLLTNSDYFYANVGYFLKNNSLNGNYNFVR